MRQKTTHKEHLNALRRIAGQVKGIEKMIEEEKYCIDIIIQLRAAINALYRVSEQIFAKHLQGCVRSAFAGSNKGEKNKKIQEIISVISMQHRL